MDRHKTEALLDKYLQGECTMEEVEKIHAWLKQLNRDEKEWSGKEPHEQTVYLEGLYDDIRNSVDRRKNSRKKIGRPGIIRIAAALLLLCCASVLFYTYRTTEIEQDASPAREFLTASVPSDEVRELRLEDGSVIWLNEGSSLRYPEKFGSRLREVFLEGEAFFEVARNPSRPFVIHTANTETRVLGTSFNIQAYKEDEAVRVVVVSGKVEVSATPGKAGRKKEKVVLQASQMATYAADKQIDKEAVVDPEEYTSWKEGKLVFNKTPMSEVAQRLERAFGLKVAMENSAIANCKITGRFDREQEPGLTVEAICKSIEADYTLEGGMVYIRGQGCEN